MEATYMCSNDLDKFGGNNAEIFRRLFDSDYMKLLNLDNVVEEESYRAAVERPLSPTLPVIEFESNQSDNIDDSRLTIVNGSSGGLPSVSTCTIPCCRPNGRSNEMNYNISTVKRYDDCLEICRNGEAEKSNTMHVTSVCISEAQDSIAAFRISDSGDKETKTSSGNEFGSIHDDSSQYVVFPETMDSSSLSKIFSTTRTFRTQCCAFSQTDCVVKNIVSCLSADKILSPREKVCVFFSMFLKSFSGIALTNFNRDFDGNFLSTIDIFSGQVRKVMSDVETRAMFLEVCNLDDLVTLIENFIINGKVLVHNDMNSETPTLLESLNDKSVPLSFYKASTHQLVFGAVLLASFCAAIDCIDFICVASYTIFCYITSSSTLPFVYVFAYICGEKLFTHGDYSLIMTVIKSLITYCERENLSSGFTSCTKCPFSEGAISMEELALLLLERLCSYASHTHEFRMTTFKSKMINDGTLSDLGDVLSLLELLASKMSWSWVWENIVSQLLKLLEACGIDTFLTAILVLLGRIARLGIDANGFQDTKVDNIRLKLSSFISQATSNKFSLPVQFAAVNALLTTSPLNFQEICKNSKDLPPLVSPSIPADCIQKWFSFLNEEQKSLSFKL